MATSNGNNGSSTENATGSEVIIEATPGKTIKLSIESLQNVQFVQDAGNLLVIPADGGEPILLQDFLTFGATENPPKIELMNGEIVEIAEITPLVQGFSLADINPQAGDDNSDGGGANFRPFTDGSIGDPLEISDLLAPTELTFSREEEEEIIGENDDLPSTTTPSDDPGGIVTLSFSTAGGAAGPATGGYEDWQPNQNVGDTTEAPMQMLVEFTPETDEELTSIDISGFPDGTRFFVGGTTAGDEVDVTSGSFSVLAAGGVLPAMYVLPPANSDSDITLSVLANFVNGGGDTGTSNVTGTAIIDAVADAPTVSGGDASGDENTAIAIPEITAALQDTDGSETLAVSIGGIPVGATLSDGVNSFVGDGNELDVTGWDLASLTITPPTDDDTDFALTVTATATETATVAGGGELTEANNTASSTFTVDVTVNDVPPADDGPTAVDDGPFIKVEAPDIHAVFVIDTSGSMNWNELSLMEEALKNLATTLFEQNPDGTAITLIDFDETARFIGGGTFTTLESVMEALNPLDAWSGGNTNYEDALNLTRTVDFVPGYDQAIYFISDGQPTIGDTQAGIDSFNDWVTNDLNNAKVYAVGLGGDAENSAYLGQIDNTPDDNNLDPAAGDPYLYVENAEDLSSSLQPTDAWVTGNVLDNDILGSDPLADIPITSFTYNGVTYDLSATGPGISIEGNVIGIDTEFGVFELNLETGEYAYLVQSDVANFETEEFGYTIIDNDGSTSSAVLTVTIAPDNSFTGTAVADDINGGASNDYIVGGGGDDTLFGGDGDDRFIFQNASTDGNDVIEDFGANGDADVIDLTALFDELGIAPGDRADHVLFSEDSGNTTITVTDGADAEITGFSIVVENAALNSSDITNGKIVVDES
ncbi:VWA domain-containing protein [Sneathiella litorea]|uniref:VWA domain-containing protein n=1 Tax=Sneathiella litorea TaxID=2606216 RepID=A0A6L8W8D7_9PROT|nr:VWA domain-containing protein [Sneathiella litorea]MZR31355.1 VWA domain-containing protein [Sneathiella litorea]